MNVGARILNFVMDTAEMEVEIKQLFDLNLF